MSVSHPNCISAYKLSVLRLQRGDDLLEPFASATSLPPGRGNPAHPSPTPAPSGGSAGALAAQPGGGLASDAALLSDGTTATAGVSRSVVSEPLGGGSSLPSSGQGRRVRSLLSGAEAEVIEDAYGPLQPGLYETMIVSEVGGVRVDTPAWFVGEGRRGAAGALGGMHARPPAACACTNCRALHSPAPWHHSSATAARCAMRWRLGG